MPRQKMASYLVTFLMKQFVDFQNYFINMIKIKIGSVVTHSFILCLLGLGRFARTLTHGQPRGSLSGRGQVHPVSHEGSKTPYESHLNYPISMVNDIGNLN